MPRRNKNAGAGKLIFGKKHNGHHRTRHGSMRAKEGSRAMRRKAAKS